MLLCKYCSKECKNDNSLRNHERLCSHNPDKQESSLKAYHASGASKGNKSKTGIPAWNKGLPGTFTGKKHSEESKLKMAESKNALYASGWESAFCKFADENKLTWRRNKIRFPYIKPNGKPSTYQPDFYVEEWGSYIEIKGYETDLDKAKWSQFPEPLRVLRKEQIGKLDELV